MEHDQGRLVPFQLFQSCPEAQVLAQRCSTRLHVTFDPVARQRHLLEGAKARSRAASKAKGLGTNLSLPPKLLPSRESGRGSGAELFLCEGDSALGTIKAARDATFQAVADFHRRHLGP